MVPRAAEAYDRQLKNVKWVAVVSGVVGRRRRGKICCNLPTLTQRKTCLFQILPPEIQKIL